ncbi:MAG: hypothetical protein ACR2GT_06710 [Gaiellaceae bacterium]
MRTHLVAAVIATAIVATVGIAPAGGAVAGQTTSEVSTASQLAFSVSTSRDDAASADGPKLVLDTAPPTVSVLGWSGPAGSAVPLRARVEDNRGATVTVEFRVKSIIRLVKSVTVAARANGSLTTAVWRAPKGLRGTFTVCATATDAAGNESGRSCAIIRLR